MWTERELAVLCSCIVLTSSFNDRSSLEQHSSIYRGILSQGFYPKASTNVQACVSIILNQVLSVRMVQLFRTLFTDTRYSQSFFPFIGHLDLGLNQLNGILAPDIAKLTLLGKFSVDSDRAP